LQLKVLTPSSAPQALAFFRRNAAFREPWSPAAEPDFFSLEGQRRRLHDDWAAMQRGQQLKLWLFRGRDADLAEVIGYASVSHIVRGAFLSCFLGYEMSCDHLNRGYITEALQALVFDIAFGPLGLHRVEANVMPHNAASIRVLEKLGFTDEGLARRYLRINGAWQDHRHLVILNESVD
jgi:[ribosomal protein S5]-alanine N-acetyltransferase